jgi:hypothetical protein
MLVVHPFMWLTQKLSVTDVFLNFFHVLLKPIIVILNLMNLPIVFHFSFLLLQIKLVN